jgi:adenylate cyclase
VTGERIESRLAAVVHGDVVGFSRLTAEDPDATLEALAERRLRVAELVAEHRGRVADFSGDNFLAEFRSATEAVRCAVAIQRAGVSEQAQLPQARRIRFRLGAHLGEVRAHEGRILGDGVNVAARLQALAEPGGVCISEALHDQVRQLPFDFEELGPQRLKNIPAPVRALRIGFSGAEPAGDPGPRRGRIPRGVLATAGAFGIALVLAVAVFPLARDAVLDRMGLAEPAAHLPLPDKPSVVVLPFEFLGGDSRRRYLADALTQEITQSLSTSFFLFVIARNSAYAYADQTMRVEEIARELGVRYVLEGSVQAADDRLRVTAQLIDATTSLHVWSQRYDRELRDVFTVQSEIAEAIFDAVGIQVHETEYARIRRKPTENLNAYEAFERAFVHVMRVNRKDNQEARRLAERAMELDPNYADALGLLAATYNFEYAFLWNRDPEVREKAESLARQAFELDSSSLFALSGLAVAAVNRQDPDAVESWARRSLEISPNTPAGHSSLAIAHAMRGEFLDSLRSMRRGVRGNPKGIVAWGTPLGLANYGLGRRDRAVAIWEQTRNSSADELLSRALLAAHYYDQGEAELSRLLVAEVVAVNPELTVENTIEALRLERMQPALAESMRVALQAGGMS